LKEPTLSILTPSFGYARYIDDAIQSVSHQRFVKAQHVIADGGSTDGTVEILRNHSDVTWISEPDRGQSEALNRAFSLASHPLIGWLNADEFYLPGALRRVIAAFEDPHVDVVYGDAAFVDPDGRLLRLVPQHPFSRSVLRHYGTYIASCAAFFRRRALGDSPWDIDARRIMDWDLYLRLASSGAHFRYIAAPLGAFRVHPERVTATPLAKDDPELLRIRSRHDLPDSRWGRSGSNIGGRALHTLLKVRHGSYQRQRTAARIRGTDLRWWPPHTMSAPTGIGLGLEEAMVGLD
jgi:glycosyltransferase involved in cell wall biosynthesis